MTAEASHLDRDAAALAPRRGRRRIDWSGYLLVAFFTVPFLMFNVLPVLFGGFVAFTRWSIIGRPHWVGLQNFHDAFADEWVRIAFVNTGLYGLVIVPGVIVFGLIFALFVNQRWPLSALARTLFFAPNVVSATVIGLLWVWVLDTQFGLVNKYLNIIGIPDIPWLTSTSWALIGVSVASIWWDLGVSFVLFLAALQDIPRDLYEAASVDGANAFEKFRFVTLPQLKPTISMVVTLQLISTLRIFSQVYVMTNGGPAGSSSSVIHYIYTTAIVRNLYGYSAAVSMLLFVAIIVITVLQRTLIRGALGMQRQDGIVVRIDRLLRPWNLRLVQVPVWLAGTFAALLWAAPFVWMVSTSFKLPGDVMTVNVEWIPRQVTLDNYIKVFQYPVLRWGLNSLIVAVVATTLTVLFGAMAGYAIARLRFPGRRFLFSLFLLSLMVPTEVSVVPMLLGFIKVGWANTYQALILPLVGNVFSVYIFRQFYLKFPADLEDAAKMDGASHWGIFWRIAFPLARAPMIATAVIVFTLDWNNFLWPLLVTFQESMKTMPVGIAAFAPVVGTQTQLEGYSVSMAGVTLLSLPSLLLFFFLQKYFIQGIASSGVKG